MMPAEQRRERAIDHLRALEEQLLELLADAAQRISRTHAAKTKSPARAIQGRWWAPKWLDTLKWAFVSSARCRSRNARKKRPIRSPCCASATIICGCAPRRIGLRSESPIRGRTRSAR